MTEDRLRAQAIAISTMLSDAGVGAMPITEGVQTVIRERDGLRDQRDHWRREYKTLETHIQETAIAQRDSLKDENEKLKAERETHVGVIQQLGQRIAQLESLVNWEKQLPAITGSWGTCNVCGQKSPMEHIVCPYIGCEGTLV